MHRSLRWAVTIVQCVFSRDEFLVRMAHNITTSQHDKSYGFPRMITRQNEEVLLASQPWGKVSGSFVLLIVFAWELTTISNLQPPTAGKYVVQQDRWHALREMLTKYRWMTRKLKHLRPAKLSFDTVRPLGTFDVPGHIVTTRPCETQENI